MDESLILMMLEYIIHIDKKFNYKQSAIKIGEAIYKKI